MESAPRWEHFNSHRSGNEISPREVGTQGALEQAQFQYQGGPGYLSAGPGPPYDRQRAARYWELDTDLRRLSCGWQQRAYDREGPVANPEAASERSRPRPDRISGAPRDTSHSHLASDLASTKAATPIVVGTSWTVACATGTTVGDRIGIHRHSGGQRNCPAADCRPSGKGDALERKNIPSNDVVVPSVADWPTSKNTPVRRSATYILTLEALAVVSVLPIWKTIS